MRFLPMIDIHLFSQNTKYESILKPHEDILLYALRHEKGLAAIAQLVNENKFTLRNAIKTLIDTLPTQ